MPTQLANIRPYPAFHVIAKPSGPICNLDCHYCFYLEKEKLYPGTAQWRMSPDVLENYVRQYIAAQEAPQVDFTWQGGEPTLLGLEFFQNVVRLQEKYAYGRRITNALQTNAVLIDDVWAAFLAQHQFLVGVSIDGPEELHNRFRPFKSGRGSFAEVLRGLQCLQRAGAEFNTLTAVNSVNSHHPLEVYRFLKEIGSRYLQFMPVVERAAAQPTAEGLSLVSPSFAEEAAVTPWSVEPLQYGLFLSEIFDEWVQHDVARYFVQLFDVALENWLGLTPALCIFRETCGAALAIEHNGDVYSCDHFVYPEHRLGNIQQTGLEVLVNSPQQVTFGNNKRDLLPQYCRNCDVRFACHGECPQHRFLHTPDGEYGLNYLCAGYKYFFQYIDPYMKFMAGELRQRRPPANVMPWAQARLLAGIPRLFPSPFDYAQNRTMNTGTSSAVALTLTAAMFGAAALAEDTVTYLGGKAGKETLRRTGTIEDYGSTGLVLVTAQGRRETIALDKLVSFQTAATEEELAGDKLKLAGKLAEAIDAYKKAKRAESRQWVIRRISRSLVDCYDVAGQIDQAGDEFLAIVAADAETPYFGSIPLAWRSPTVEGPVVMRAPRWLAAANQPAAELLGASWLLAGPERAKAIAALKTLSNDLDPRIAHLAAAQLWRTSLVTATTADAQKWRTQIERMPAELRAGPLLVLGDYYARSDGSDEALLAYLQVPLVYDHRQALSGEGLVSSARLMEKLKRHDDARRLYREVEAKYPAFANRNDIPKGN